jgi:hypothetical protein
MNIQPTNKFEKLKSTSNKLGQVLSPELLPTLARRGGELAQSVFKEGQLELRSKRAALIERRARLRTALISQWAQYVAWCDHWGYSPTTSPWGYNDDG